MGLEALCGHEYVAGTGVLMATMRSVARMHRTVTTRECMVSGSMFVDVGVVCKDDGQCSACPRGRDEVGGQMVKENIRQNKGFGE